MDLKIYQLTDEEKQDLILRLTNDISFQDESFEIESDDLSESEQDVLESQDETEELF